MCGSFNNYARKVWNANLPLAIRASALRSCIGFVCDNMRGSRNAMLIHLGDLVGGDLFHSAQEAQLLAALQRIELARNRILELKRAFERKRIRHKFRGRRVPSTAELQALSEAITAVRRATGILPDQETKGIASSR